MKRFETEVLAFNLQASMELIGQRLREYLRTPLNRRGLVVAISGGIDSSVCAALAVQAIGATRVFGLMLPEDESSASSLENGKVLAEHLGIPYQVVNITPILKACDAYKDRDNAIRSLFPNYGAGWKNKIAITGGMEGRYNVFDLVVESPTGESMKVRLGPKEYLRIVAATNFKQRVRKMLEYSHADRLHYAVVGTPNRLEYDQGFFVKNGDGAADVKPIAHLYKSQVYLLAKHLKLPEVICNAIPTTDTYSLAQGQDEFYFALPYAQMDRALWALNNGIPAQELAVDLKIQEQQAERIYEDIRVKRAATRYLHAKPLLVEPVELSEV